MRVLLDTHALLWWALDDERLSALGREMMADAATAVHVSAASAWEIATKVRLGKLPGASHFAAELSVYLARQGFQELPITLQHGQRAGALPGPHKDPFDRMLIAQAQAENLTVVSNEIIFEQYGVGRLW